MKTNSLHMTKTSTGSPGDVHITSLTAHSPVITTWCVPASGPLHILFPLPDCERKKKPGLPTQVQDAPFPKVILKEGWRVEGDIW
jgi:hypothetical protein